LRIQKRKNCGPRGNGKTGGIRRVEKNPWHEEASSGNHPQPANKNRTYWCNSRGKRDQTHGLDKVISTNSLEPEKGGTGAEKKGTEPREKKELPQTKTLGSNKNLEKGGKRLVDRGKNKNTRTKRERGGEKNETG